MIRNRGAWGKMGYGVSYGRKEIQCEDNINKSNMHEEPHKNKLDHLKYFRRLLSFENWNSFQERAFVGVENEKGTKSSTHATTTAFYEKFTWTTSSQDRIIIT